MEQAMVPFEDHHMAIRPSQCQRLLPVPLQHLQPVDHEHLLAGDVKHVPTTKQMSRLRWQHLQRIAQLLANGHALATSTPSAQKVLLARLPRG